MKCPICGFIIKNSSCICDKCGGKLIIDHRYINIGYPLGKKYNQEYTFLLDMGNNEIILNQEQAKIWCQLPSHHQNVTNNTEFIKLINDGAILDLNNNIHLEQFLSCVPYRNGFGGVHNGKHAIILSNSPVYVPEMHLTIWRYANGSNTINDILRLCQVEQTQFIKIIIELMTYTLLFIKYK